MLKVDKVINHCKEAGGFGHLCALLCQVFNLSLTKSPSAKKPDLFVSQLKDNLDVNMKAKHAGAYGNKTRKQSLKNNTAEHLPEKHI